MKFKGFEILPVYACGSDMRELKNGSFVFRKPTSKDIEYYEVTDLSDGLAFCRDFTIKLAKASIVSLLNKLRKAGL